MVKKAAVEKPKRKTKTKAAADETPKKRRTTLKVLVKFDDFMANTHPLMKDIAQILSGEKKLGRQEARLLVDTFYMLQEARIQSSNRLKAMSDSDEPIQTVEWFTDGFRFLENQLKAILEVFTDNEPSGRWLKAHRGIGPIIAAGLLAHIDIEKAQTAGAIWRYAGLDPSQTWKKGEKRPWNASLKRLCWILGENGFVKNPPSLYNTLYKERKDFEIARNLAGYSKELALKEKERVGKSTLAYKAYAAGVLPDGRIHTRAHRYAVKIFLAHFHEQLWREKYGTRPPKPYVIEHMGHTHMIENEVPYTVQL